MLVLLLLEDSHPQAIFKLHHPSSLDYRARHKLPVKGRGLKKVFICLQAEKESQTDFHIIDHFHWRISDAQSKLNSTNSKVKIVKTI